MSPELVSICTHAGLRDAYTSTDIYSHAHTYTQLRRETHPSKASDVYAFGITLFEAFSRQEPYEGENGHAVLKAVADAHARYPKRPSLPDGCPMIVGSLMPDCWDRFVSVLFWS